MHRIPLVILFQIILWPLVGCQWAGLRDPVPAALTTSRRLSSEGNEYLEQKQPERAEAKLAEAVKTCPTDCDARRYYAETLWLRNARPEAVAQLEEACRLSPDPDVRIRLAEIYLEMGRPDEAERNVNHVLGQNLKLAAAWRVHGRVLRAKGDGLLAAGDRDKARTIYFQALADLHRAAGYDPADRRVVGETAAVYRSLGQPQRALETMQSLGETYSPGEEPQAILYWTGWDYMALRRYDDAVVSFTTALSRGGRTPELFYSLGEAQYHSGRRQEADATLRQALAIDPQHAPSRRLLNEIQVAQQGGAALRR
jgi:tetratricopeptide (TPR) repeat protein